MPQLFLPQLSPVEPDSASILAEVLFNQPSQPARQSMQIATGLPLLLGTEGVSQTGAEATGEGESDVREYWLAGPSTLTVGTVEKGVSGNIHWSKTPEQLCAALWFDDRGDCLTSTRVAYQELLAFVQNAGYPYLVRVWNYLLDINQGEGDNERYRQFCLGRQQAFEAANYPQNQYCAASALGHKDGHNLVYLIAMPVPGQHFENPRQVSAYEYPRQYGPVGPSFARATVVNAPFGGSDILHISGTASIVGHKTLYPDSIEQQLEVTLENISGLLDHVNSARMSKECFEHFDLLKMYIRAPEHYRLVREAVESIFGQDTPALYLRADICRSDLQVEIEGIALSQSAFSQNGKPCAGGGSN